MTPPLEAAFSLLMRYSLVIILLPAVLACGGYRFPGGPSPATGTITGQVLSTPCSPVVRPGNPCADRPVANLTLSFSGAQSAVWTTVTDSQGNYSIQLATGVWRVSFKTSFGRILSGPPTVTVEAGATVIANYIIDSGIRVPAPAG